jgi:hypothetical protein
VLIEENLNEITAKLDYSKKSCEMPYRGDWGFKFTLFLEELNVNSLWRYQE